MASAPKACAASAMALATLRARPDPAGMPTTLASAPNCAAQDPANTRAAPPALLESTAARIRPNTARSSTRLPLATMSGLLRLVSQGYTEMN